MDNQEKSDRQTVALLIARDEEATRRFFYDSCRPLLLSVMGAVFPYEVEYDELVGELYHYLMADDAARLRQFQYRSSLYLWLKVVATRFFIHHRSSVIENASHEPLYISERQQPSYDTARHTEAQLEVEQLLELMGNERYQTVIRRLCLADEAPDEVARSMGVTVANLYNIKRRAMALLAQTALNNHFNAL